MLSKIRTTLGRRFGYAGFPSGIDFKITDACNMRCRYCPQWGPDGIRPDPPAFMDSAAMLDLVAQVASFRPWIRLIGGEPLLHPDWARLVSVAGTHGMWCAAVTNGTLIAEQAEVLVTSGLHRLGVSIDGAAPVHDAQRGEGSLARVARGLAELDRVKRRLGSETPLIEAYTTVHRDNYSRLADLAGELRSWGISKLRLQQLIWASPEQFDRSLDQLRRALPGFSFFGADMAYRQNHGSGIDPDTLRRQLDLVRSGDYPFDVELHPDLEPGEWGAFHGASDYRRSNRVSCTMMETYAFVDPLGRLHPCVTVDLGNVFEQPFSRVWNGRRFRAFRRLIRSQGRLPFCHRCPD